MCASTRTPATALQLFAIAWPTSAASSGRSTTSGLPPLTSSSLSITNAPSARTTSRNSCRLGAYTGMLKLSLFSLSTTPSRTRSSHASWKCVPKRRPAPPWSAGSAELRPRQARNMAPPRFISRARDRRKRARSAWNWRLYAAATASVARWTNTRPPLYATDVLSLTSSGTCESQCRENVEVNTSMDSPGKRRP
uniref:Secreted protein n=1 Tax=Oryza punctata TaxID=4537 RepID=A0A0E0KWE7_ORYPU